MIAGYLQRFIIIKNLVPVMVMQGSTLGPAFNLIYILITPGQGSICNAWGEAVAIFCCRFVCPSVRNARCRRTCLWVMHLRFSFIKLTSSGTHLLLAMMLHVCQESSVIWSRTFSYFNVSVFYLTWAAAPRRSVSSVIALQDYAKHFCVNYD